VGRRLGHAVASRRKALGLTQDDLAGIVEVDAETISRIERGAVVPSLQRLAMIAGALHAGIGELLSEASPLPSDRVHQLVSRFDSLKEDDRALLLDFAELLARRAG
jgi:transcriptional regulator with XRE-family HTH domain